MAFESFQSGGIQKPIKIGSTLAIVEYGGHLEGFLATPKGQTTSSALTINYCHSLREGLETLTSSTPTNNYCHSFREELETLISSVPTNNHHCSLKEGLETWTSSTYTNNYYPSFREGLETQLVSITSILFISSSDIPDVTSSSIESIKTGYVFWHRYCRRSEIKELTLVTCSLCEYKWEVILCMVLTSERCLGPDIWSETPDQVKDTEDMIRTI